MSTLPEVNIVQAPLGIDNIPEFFNDHFTDGEWNIFLAPNVVYHSSVIQEVQNIIVSYPEVACIYTDSSFRLSVNNDICCNLYYPCYNFNINNTVNLYTPVICSSKVETRFDTTIKTLYYANFWNHALQQYIAWHVPKVLFTLPHLPKTQQLINEHKILSYGNGSTQYS